MKKIVKINHIPTEAIAIKVEKGRPIWRMTDNDIIKTLKLKKAILNYHYKVEDRYHEIGDLYSEQLVEYVADLLYNYCKDDNFDGYDEIATRIICNLEDELIEAIYEADDSSVEWNNARREALAGRY